MKTFINSVIATFIIMVTLFLTTFLLQENFEFLFYIATMLIIGSIIYISMLKGIEYSKTTLVLLLTWGFLHMLGGIEMSNGNIIYTFVFYEFIQEPFSILKYDQVVHILGFGSAAFAVFDILKSKMQISSVSNGAILFIIIFTAMGLGTLNEMIEFIATLYFENDVGGYENTLIDLFSNFIGIAIASLYLYIRYLKKN